jgi:DNA polymerase-3 subunit epsilon
MAMQTDGIANRLVTETPIAVFDFETTGLIPGLDRVVEVSVMRKEPGAEATLVLDTLVNPQRSVAATEIHGITDDDVVDAPTFEEIAGDVLRALSGCVAAAYNVYFDMRFLDDELQRVGIDDSPPYFCLMYMRPLLGLGKRCSLGEACKAHDIDYDSAHVAMSDVRSSMQLLEFYLDEMRARDVATFGDFARLKPYKFMDSFHRLPIPSSEARSPEGRARLKPRGVQPVPKEGVPPEMPTGGVSIIAGRPVGDYWEVLKAAVCDLEITEDELRILKKKKRDLGLQVEQVRALHARIFAGVISRFVDDQRIDERERNKLYRLHRCLSQLGWAPGE